jgi:uncharacterized protein
MSASSKIVRSAVFVAACCAGMACDGAFARSKSGSATADKVPTLAILGSEPQLSEFEQAIDLATVCSQALERKRRDERVRLLSVVGEGGVQGVRDLLYLSGIDMTIVSVPTLNRLRESKELGRLDEKIVYFWRMPVMEVHVLAAPEIGKIDDLVGRKVNFGPLDSDAAMIARRLFSAVTVDVMETNLGYGEAM